MHVHISRASDRRGSFGCLMAILTGLVVLVVVLLGALVVAALGTRAGSVASSPPLPPQPGSVTWEGRARLTALLLEVTPSHRIDELALASYSPSSRSSSLLSIPADLWVTVPGFGQNLISEAYQLGGARLTRLTVESVTHVPIPYYAAVPASTFRQLIDMYGGITVQAGYPRHLSGAAALTFEQDAGHTPGSTQSWRQQAALLALLGEIGTPDGLARLPSAISAVGGGIETNFPFAQLPALAQTLSAARSRARVARIGPGNGTALPYDAAGMPVLLPNRDQLTRLARQLAGDTLVSSDGSVEVLNGSGVQGQAAALAGWLRQANVRVAGYASADSFDYPHTIVRVSPDAAASTVTLARDVASLILAPIIRTTRVDARTRVVVVIGRDFQDPSQQ